MPDQDPFTSVQDIALGGRHLVELVAHFHHLADGLG